MKQRYIIVILAVIIIASITTFIISTNDKTDNKSELILQINEKGEFVNNVENTFDTSMIFKDLPQKPPLFDLITRNFLDNQIKDLTLIDESVWKNPEFYPTWERSGIVTYTNHKYDRWGVHGYGFYPSEQSWNVQNMQEGDELVFYSWFHTSWGVETWQGLQLIPLYNNEYFDVQLKPNLFMIGPTYPKFDKEWVKMIEFKVIAKKSVPVGTYTVKVEITQPTIEQADEWSWKLLDEYTEGKLHNEIERCKTNSNVKNCEYLVEQRQAKYVQGGEFVPSNLFLSTIHAS